jgi:phosphoribosylanthranilate isomerase
MPIPLRIKICGVTSSDDVNLCAEAGADAVGLNFHPSSPRYVDPKTAQPIIRALPPLMTAVGVFVAIPMRQCCAVAYQLGLRAVQWYGDSFPFGLISSFRVKDRKSLSEIKTYLEMCRSFGSLPSAILVDAYVDGVMGGTGHKAPWDLLAEFKPGVPMILAGGLTPENVADAIRIVMPAAIDVASGVESRPGRKDPYKVQAFIDNARNAAARI